MLQTNFLYQQPYAERQALRTAYLWEQYAYTTNQEPSCDNYFTKITIDLEAKLKKIRKECDEDITALV